MANCPRCKTSYSGGARFCRNCGGSVPPAEHAEEPRFEIVPRSVGVRACVACGLVVPAKVATCTECEAPTAPHVVPARSDGAYWVRVTCGYQCSHCNASTPLARFTDEGRASCVLCGRAQDLPILFWRTVLRHAHAVGDLAGASIGAKNPYEDVGVGVAELADERIRDADDTPHGLAAATGHPGCLGCGAPIDGAWSGEPCKVCGLRASAVKPALATRVDRGLVAILEREPAPTSGAVLSLKCPTCSAPLTVDEGTSTATCRYCKGAALVVAPTAVRKATPRGVWLLFTGPSARRADLTRA